MYAPDSLSFPLARYSNRCIALTPASVDVFQTAGVWERVVDQRVHPYRSMQVWDSCSNGHIWLDADDVWISDGTFPPLTPGPASPHPRIPDRADLASVTLVMSTIVLAEKPGR